MVIAEHTIIDSTTLRYRLNENGLAFLLSAFPAPDT